MPKLATPTTESKVTPTLSRHRYTDGSVVQKDTEARLATAPTFTDLDIAVALCQDRGYLVGREGGVWTRD